MNSSVTKQYDDSHDLEPRSRDPQYLNLDI